MKYLCLIGHEIPGDEPGRFKRFEAGKEYDGEKIGEPEPGYFRECGIEDTKPAASKAAKKNKSAEEEK